MEISVRIPSDGLILSGILHVPDSYKPGMKLPAFIVLHGFLGSKDRSHSEIKARMLCEWGYIALRIDFRGCGDSEGKRGYVLCLDQVADTRNCLEWLADRTEVSPDRIGVMGHSFGAAVSVYTAGVDKRVAAVISTCGWGHGERKFRGQHPSENDWKKFTSIMAEGAAHKEKTGEALWVSRWDVVPVTKELRKYLPEDPQTKVSVDTVQSMFNFCAEDVVADIAPRPILFIHTANDTVTPTEQSLRMFERAGMPAELYTIVGESHFPLAGTGEPARTFIKSWLDRYFPVDVQ